MGGVLNPFGGIDLLPPWLTTIINKQSTSMAYNKKAVLAANAEAIRVVLRLEKEHRLATEAEKRILRGYQGFRRSEVRIEPHRYTSGHPLLEQIGARTLCSNTTAQADDLSGSGRCSHRQAVLGEHQGECAHLILYR